MDYRLLLDPGGDDGSGTGISVVALERRGELVTPLTRETMLEPGAVLLMLGSLEQRRRFAESFETTL